MSDFIDRYFRVPNGIQLNRDILFGGGDQTLQMTVSTIKSDYPIIFSTKTPGLTSNVPGIIIDRPVTVNAGLTTTQFILSTTSGTTYHLTPTGIRAGGDFYLTNLPGVTGGLFYIDKPTLSNSGLTARHTDILGLSGGQVKYTINGIYSDHDITIDTIFSLSSATSGNDDKKLFVNRPIIGSQYITLSANKSNTVTYLSTIAGTSLYTGTPSSLSPGMLTGLSAVSSVPSATYDVQGLGIVGTYTISGGNVNFKSLVDFENNVTVQNLTGGSFVVNTISVSTLNIENKIIVNELETITALITAMTATDVTATGITATNIQAVSAELDNIEAIQISTYEIVGTNVKTTNLTSTEFDNTNIRTTNLTSSDIQTSNVDTITIQTSSIVATNGSVSSLEINTLNSQSISTTDLDTTTIDTVTLVTSTISATDITTNTFSTVSIVGTTAQLSSIQSDTAVINISLTAPVLSSNTLVTDNALADSVTTTSCIVTGLSSSTGQIDNIQSVTVNATTVNTTNLNVTSDLKGTNFIGTSARMTSITTNNFTSDNISNNSTITTNDIVANASVVATTISATNIYYNGNQLEAPVIQTSDPTSFDVKTLPFNSILECGGDGGTLDLPPTTHPQRFTVVHNITNPVSGFVRLQSSGAASFTGKGSELQSRWGRALVYTVNNNTWRAVGDLT